MVEILTLDIIMTLDNDLGYAYLINLNLMFSMSLWKEFQLLQTLNGLFVKRLVKLILCVKDIELLKFK